MISKNKIKKKKTFLIIFYLKVSREQNYCKKRIKMNIFVSKTHLERSIQV